MGRLARGGAAIGLGGTLAALLQGCAPQAPATATSVPTTAAGAAPTTSGAAPAPRQGGHFVEADTTEVKTVNPIFFSGEEGGDWIGHMLFAGLMTDNAAGEISPLLAAAPPSVSADQLTITFKLRKGVKWTDGQELTADDVVFTYKIHSDPDYAKTDTGQRLAGRFTSITAPDPYTVVFTLTKVWPAFLLANCHYGIVPKHVLGSLSAEELNTASFNQNPTAVSGAFKMQAFQAGQQVALERNAASFMSGSQLDGYVLRQLSNSTAVGNALQAGEIDLGPLDPSLLSSIQSSSTVSVYSYVSNATDLLFYQMDPAKPGSQIFGETAVRQALLHALDRESMIKAIYFNQAVVGDSALPLASWAHTSEGIPQYGFDRAKAQALLDGAGWKMGPNGVRQKNGKDLSFELLAVSGRAAYSDLVASLADQWKAIGAQATTRLQDSNAVVDQMIHKRDFDLLLFPLTIGADPDLTPLWKSTATAQGGYNASHYMNAEVDKLIDDAAGTNDINQRKQLYAQVQQKLMTDLPAAPLFYPKALYGVSKRVNGVQSVLGAYNRYQRAWMKDVWVSGGN
jgi:peptide/nickel transport system substrate-binding protein